MRHQVFLSLGTNLGQRRHNLERAIAGLQEIVWVTAVSPVYETDPWGVTDQPAFYNACLAGKTDYSPVEFLTFIKNLEIEMGRVPNIPWGPRLIDIDILLFDDLVVQMGTLAIPHPHLPERAFVLIPLAAIAPDVVHPELDLTIRELAMAVSPAGVCRLAEPLVVNTAVIA